MARTIPPPPMSYRDYKAERHYRILKAMFPLAKMDEEDFILMIQNMPDNELAVKTFEQFCLKLKLILSDKFAERNAEEAKQKIQAEAYRTRMAKERKELLDWCALVKGKQKFRDPADQLMALKGLKEGFLRQTFWGFYTSTDKLERELNRPTSPPPMKR